MFLFSFLSKDSALEDRLLSLLKMILHERGQQSVEELRIYIDNLETANGSAWMQWEKLITLLNSLLSSVFPLSLFKALKLLFLPWWCCRHRCCSYFVFFTFLYSKDKLYSHGRIYFDFIWMGLFQVDHCGSVEEENLVCGVQIIGRQTVAF